MDGLPPKVTAATFDKSVTGATKEQTIELTHNPAIAHKVINAPSVLSTMTSGPSGSQINQGTTVSQVIFYPITFEYQGVIRLYIGTLLRLISLYILTWLY